MTHPLRRYSTDLPDVPVAHGVHEDMRGDDFEQAVVAAMRAIADERVRLTDLSAAARSANDIRRVSELAIRSSRLGTTSKALEDALLERRTDIIPQDAAPTLSAALGSLAHAGQTATVRALKAAGRALPLEVIPGGSGTGTDDAA